MTVSRGFHGRRVRGDASRVPPGQYVTADFPVLSAGQTPRTPLDQWTFTIRGERPVSPCRGRKFQALPRETVTVDIHCVTKWSKLGTTWTGVSVETLLADVETSADYVMAFCDGGYTTNLPVEDLLDRKAWVACEYDHAPLAPEHGGPGPAAGTALVLLEKREVDPRPGAAQPRRTGLLGNVRLPQLRRPVERTALRRRLNWQAGTVVDVTSETTETRSIALHVPGWPGHRAGQHVDVRLTAEDGYSAQRSYSIASAPEDDQLVLTVERLPDGEVSAYLVDELQPGDELELRGPVGGYFIWEERPTSTGECCLTSHNNLH